MRQYLVYVCDTCGKESLKSDEIELCQANHMGLHDIQSYREWEALAHYAKVCTWRLSSQNNQRLRDEEEQAYKKLIAFEQEHGMSDIK